jgi:hypothetical protein
MEISDFKKLVFDRFDKCSNLMLGPKDKEYSRGGDKLYNFKRAGVLQNITPEKALLGMWSKHLISIIDIINEIDVKIPSKEMMNEKINDNINYLFLLEGLIEERRLELEKNSIQHEIIEKYFGDKPEEPLKRQNVNHFLEKLMDSAFKGNSTIKDVDIKYSDNCNKKGLPKKVFLSVEFNDGEPEC